MKHCIGYKLEINNLGYTTFFFGAGASYGSQESDTPPIGVNLLSKLQTFDEGSWGNIPQEMQVKFKNDFELGMKLMIEHKEYSYQVPNLQRKMAEYFYQYYPNSDSLYIEIFKRIRNNMDISNFKFVTLNYERLLELSAHRVGLCSTYSKEEVDTRKIEICYPHGCCNLFCKQIGGNGKIIAQANSIKANCIKPHKIDNDSEFKRWINSSEIPVMSYFEGTKSTPFGGAFIEHQRQRMCEIFSDSNVICIIGMKVREHDSHIWECLKNSLAKIIYCSGEEDGIGFLEWSNQHRVNKGDKVIFDGFFQDNIGYIFEELNIK